MGTQVLAWIPETQNAARADSSRPAGPLGGGIGRNSLEVQPVYPGP